MAYQSLGETLVSRCLNAKRHKIKPLTFISSNFSGSNLEKKEISQAKIANLKISAFKDCS